ncbi:hypothetical protein M9H77_05915 [Catharanthus roseus]|uniref:Uncharacterized protein n=1 Tax=Catharanthus roseus TaxID=4058 RepID=A0ACC0BQM0_CATRO|nr:hypothetical protein M9H77_05915 [Catharanthus roseus]
MLTATVDPLSHHDLHILFGRRAISDGASVSSLPSIIKPMNGALMATNTLPQEMDACNPESQKPENDNVGCPAGNGAVSGINCSSSASLAGADATLGRHIARRLVEIGIRDVFSVPGDFNLTLLDHLIAEPKLNNIGCCNELNAGYAADGYARHRGVSACVVTFTVGGLSILNAIAGAYSENLPVICIVGGPNSNDYGTNRILHHTIGLADFTQELRCFQTVTCYQAVVNNIEDAHEEIDKAISTALRESKPVYISVSCNLAGITHPTFSREPIPFSLTPRYEFQMQYGSIGWSVGTTLGYAQSATDKRVIACIGDGSFQVTAQDVSTMIRCNQNSIIFLINNGGYTIEVEIHDGPYNVIKNWDYTGLVDAIHNGEGNCWTTKVRNEEELIEAIERAKGEKKDCFCFIEVIVHKDDTSKELLEWGSRVASANGRPPNPQ